ncbi:MAG: hypothetical protein A7316_05345 [Candidatus Altiarchaeales archaeon WOR_SM1_86-2]|nr:MAG: hypothetical protein A7316_05345 [Candidatus Altiarchaeales archaeon WOR_SM1_86-2]
MVLIGDPAVDILIVAAALAMMSALVTKVTLGEKGRKSREKMKEMQKQLKAAQKSKNMKKMQKIQKEMMAAMMENLQHSFKPMLVTIIPFILIFGWLYSTYGVGETDYLFIHVVGKGGEHLFTWNDVPGDGSGQFEQFLAGELEINWLENAQINKSKDNRTITVTNGENSLTAELKKEKNRVAISPKDGKTREYVLMEEDGKMNVYVERSVIEILGVGLTWFWWYLICVFAISIPINKLLKNY